MGGYLSTSSEPTNAALLERIQALEARLEDPPLTTPCVPKSTASAPLPAWHGDLMTEIKKRREQLRPVNH